MKPVINVDESPGKVVGRRTNAATDYDRLVEASQSLMPHLPYPKGVYRFRTHEEADEWMNQHIQKAALKKLRARPSEGT